MRLSIRARKVYNDAGYIAVNGGKSHLFYWFFESRNDPKNDPFVLWMPVVEFCPLFIRSRSIGS